jgi:nitrate reductase NapAB chaperone NapD
MQAYYRRLSELMLFRFLLAQLYLGSLIGKKSPKAIKTALKRLPAGSEEYDYAYKEVMERIEGQIKDSEKFAKDILSWITCAKRPLTTLELRHALAVEIGASELDEENLPEIKDMVSVCAGLVTVDEESDIIRLIHYTTPEYFQRTWASWFPNAEGDIGTACVTYLSYNTFEAGCCPKRDFQKRLRENALYGYAAQNWAYHARTASIESEQLILNFLESEPKVSGSFQAVVASLVNYYKIDLERSEQIKVKGVHLAAYFGLTKTIRILLKNGHDKDSKDDYAQTPLSWAASEGQEEVVKLLLEEGVDADSKDDCGQTPLSRAAENGHEAVVKQLLAIDSVDVNSKDNGSRTALSWAAGNGHEVVVKQLLAIDGVDVNSKDKYGGQTALWWAARNGHEAVFKQLLMVNGVDVSSKDDNGGQTATWTATWAARYGDEAVVRIDRTMSGQGMGTPMSIKTVNRTNRRKKGEGIIAKLTMMICRSPLDIPSRLLNID